MAGTRAVGELVRAVIQALRRLGVRCGPEVLGVTAGTGSRICCRGVWHLIGGRGVATGAGELRVAPGGVGRSGMPEVHGAPVRITVAAGAIELRAQVPWR